MSSLALDYQEMISQGRQETLQDSEVRRVCVWTSVFLCVLHSVCASLPRTVPCGKQPEIGLHVTGCTCHTHKVKGYSVKKGLSLKPH